MLFLLTLSMFMYDRFLMQMLIVDDDDDDRKFKITKTSNCNSNRCKQVTHDAQTSTLLSSLMPLCASCILHEAPLLPFFFYLPAKSPQVAPDL